ncbi:MAG: hypothetical protein NXI28_17325, partial [bacterium]|nr:hypothetical protein [bacterium]
MSDSSSTDPASNDPSEDPNVVPAGAAAGDGNSAEANAGPQRPVERVSTGPSANSEYTDKDLLHLSDLEHVRER